MDLTIQRDAHDLVVSTYGRGVYILDRLHAASRTAPKKLAEPAALFPLADAKMFVPGRSPWASGASVSRVPYFTAPNPDGGGARSPTTFGTTTRR